MISELLQGHMTMQREAHIPALSHENPREGPKEGGLLNNSGELDVAGKRRLSMWLVLHQCRQGRMEKSLSTESGWVTLSWN